MNAKICERLKRIRSVINQNEPLVNFPMIQENLNYIKYQDEAIDEIDELLSAYGNNNINEFRNIIDNILEQYDNCNIIYHYCSMDSFINIIQSKSIWLSDSNSMNDKYEGKWNDKIMQDLRPDLIARFGQDSVDRFYSNYDELVRKNAYMFCFSKESDRLSQWRAYADDGKGVAIGFSRDSFHLSGNFDFNLSLMDVLYDVNKQKGIINQIVENNIDGDNIYNIQEFAYYFKNPSFAEEKEERFLYVPENNMEQLEFADENWKEYYRLMLNNVSEIKHRINNDKMTSYHEFNLNGIIGGFNSELIPKIVIGPKNRTDLTIIRDFLDNNGLANTEIIQSKSSYI